MSLEGMVCPACGAPISFENGRDYVFCSHCGVQVFKRDDNNKSLTIRTIDDARILEASGKINSDEIGYKKFKIKALMISVIAMMTLIVCLLTYVFVGSEYVMVELFFAFDVFLYAGLLRNKNKQ